MVLPYPNSVQVLGMEQHSEEEVQVSYARGQRVWRTIVQKGRRVKRKTKSPRQEGRRVKSRLLHPHHLGGIWSGLTPYKLPFDTLSEYPEPWLQQTRGNLS